MTMNFILCGLGAVVGACLRSYLSDSFNTKSATLPWGTILANHIGCFFIGIFLSMASRKELSSQFNTLLVGGFCGGFTTFSTYTLEYLKMALKREKNLALIYCVGSVVTCLISVFIGMWFFSII